MRFSQKALFLCLALLIGFATFLYLESLSGAFVWDDDSFITNNEWIKDTGNAGIFLTPQYWKQHHPGAKGRYRPLRTISFLANYHLGKLNPYGYHLLNLTVHVANALLVFSAARIIIGAPWAALGVALIFAAHPVNTEAVAWTKNRAELFALFFFLLSYLLVLKSECAARMRVYKASLYACGLLSYLFALMSKETALTLPLVITVHGVLLLSPSNRTNVFLKTVPLWIITFCFLAFVVWGSGGDNASLSGSPSNPFIHLSVIGKTYCAYGASLFLPINLHADRSLPIPQAIPFGNLVILGAIFFLVLLVMLKKMRSSPAVVFSVSWILLTLIPSSNLILISGRLVADQRLYIPSVGFALLVGLLLRQLEKKEPNKIFSLGFQRLKKASFVLILLSLSLITRERIPVWHDTLSLWKDSVAKNPTNHRSHYNLGLAYQDRGNVEAALQEFSAVTRLQPAYFEAHNSLGVVYASLNQIEKALYHYQRTIELNPGYARAHFNLGNTYLKMERFDEAVLSYEEAIRLNPDYTDAFANLGFVYQIQGSLDRAVQTLQQALRFNPDHALANLNLGRAYYDLGSLSLAEKHLNKVKELDAHNDEVYFLLGNISKDRGDASGAKAWYQEALRLNPRSAKALNNLGTMLQQEGNTPRAMQKYQEALHIDPNYPEAHNNLANVHSLQRDFPMAIQEFQKALALRPDYFEAQFGLAGVYLIQGNIDQALEEYGKAHKLRPDSVESYLGKALHMDMDPRLREGVERILSHLKQSATRE